MTTQRLEAAILLLERLVAFDTESAKSNLDLVAAVEDHLRALDVPYVKVPNAAGDKAALFATIGPMQDGGVVLSGHTDVVPVAGQAWTSDPFRLRREAGKLFGRGACDMKGFDALALAMIPEFQALPLKRPIHILLSYDEETTCLGPVDTIARNRIDELREILRRHPGESPVFLHLGPDKILELGTDFAVEIDRVVPDLRVAFGIDVILPSA